MDNRTPPCRTSLSGLLLHGTDGHPRENWFPWARARLESLGVVVDIPALPTPDGHSLANWTSALLAQTDRREYDLCVSHSLGTAFALRLLQSRTVRIGTFVSVAGCIGPTHIQRFDTLNETFVSPPFNWRLIREAVKTAVIVYSADDPYIDSAQSESLVRELDGMPVVLKNAGHINAAAGYCQLDVLDEVFDSVRASAVLSSVKQ